MKGGFFIRHRFQPVAFFDECIDILRKSGCAGKDTDQYGEYEFQFNSPFYN